jgi:CBS domain-containing protein
MKVRDILAVKGSRVVTTHQDNTVVEAMALFFANRIGSLLVVDRHENIKGILAPNDVLKAVHEDAASIGTKKVSQIMTKDVIAASLDDTVSYIQAIMTENRIRHIPILEHKSLKGIISIGDVVKAQIEEKEVENRYLKDYIEGKYPA